MQTEQWQWSTDKGWNGRLPSGTTGLGVLAQVVFLFGSTQDIAAGDCFAILRAAYPLAYLFGCTTAGEIHGTHVTDHTVTITALSFEHTHVATTRVPIPSITQSFEAGELLARSLDTRNLRHIFVLSEGVQVNSSRLVQGINSSLPSHVTLSGGFAGDGYRIQETLTWCTGDPVQSSVVALAFYGDRLRVGIASSAGWDPFGPDRLITRSNENVLYELDGRSALSLYKKYLGEYAKDLPTSGFLFPLVLRVGDQQSQVIRTILAVNEQEQSITFAGNMPERSYARLAHSRIEHLIDGVQAAASSSLEQLGVSSPQFSLLVSCLGRRPVLKQRIEEEIEAVSAVFGDHTTLAGFYSYGEIAPVVTGGRSELHNQTITITNFAEV